MIKMMNAYTTEVDEPEDALEEILGQLDLDALKTNSVGFFTCHPDFVDTSFTKTLCERLPFDVIGMTTLASLNKHGFDMYALSLTVLTSDDVTFKTAITESLGADDYRDKIKKTYDAARASVPEDPAMVLTFFPFLNYLSGANMVSALDEACGSKPIYGGLAANIDIDPAQCRLLRNGHVDQNALAMLLLCGPVDPEFVLVSIPKQNIRESRGLITESDGCLLKQVNNMPASKYLDHLGISLLKEALSVIPFIVYYEGSKEPVALGIYSVNDDGSILLGGEMPEGATLAIGTISQDGIMATVQESMRRVLESEKKGGVLMFPCVTRYVMLAPNQEAELRFIFDELGKSGAPPHMLTYCAGEVCPVHDESGVLHNRFHNYTFSACVF